MKNKSDIPNQSGFKLTIFFKDGFSTQTEVEKCAEGYHRIKYCYENHGEKRSFKNVIGWN